MKDAKDRGGRGRDLATYFPLIDGLCSVFSIGDDFQYQARVWDVTQEMEGTKQQLILWPDLALLGCCLVSLHFLCDIPHMHTGPVLKVISYAK